MTPVNGRVVAARVVARVLSDDAYVAAALDAELARHPGLDPRERGLATELAYGTIRCEAALHTRLLEHAPRGVADVRVLAELLIAAYQLLLLDRIPAFAAVDAAVSAVKRERGPRVAGFVNAVLRKLARASTRLSLDQALLESMPAWLLARFERELGAEQAKLLVSGDLPAPNGLRVQLGRREPTWLTELPRGRISAVARLLRGEGDVRKRPGYAEGDFTLQEEGAQVVGLSLGARAGERILDACAGRGQKSSLIAERLGHGAGAGRLIACDLYPEKLAALADELARLGLPPVETRGVDWTSGTADLPSDFDRVLVDAPCTGTGTLRRRPEIARRLRAEDPARLGALSTNILRAAASRARPGGRVVFAVCSVLAEEGEAVVESVADLLAPAPFDAPELPASLVAAPSFRLLPGVHGTDGYFVASFVRR